MTEVRVSHGRGRYRIEARGHATGSVEGCAYISGILQSVAGYLVNEDRIRVETCRMEPGDVVLRFRGGREARAAFWMAVIGLKQLEKARGELVRVCLLREAPSSVPASPGHLPPGRGKA